MPVLKGGLRRLGVAALGAVGLLEGHRRAEGFFWGKKEKQETGPDLDKAAVFIWGNGAYMARPDWEKQFSNFVPKQVTHAVRETGEIREEFPRLRQVVMGEERVFGVDGQGRVWSFDSRHFPSFFDANDPDNFVKKDGKQFNKDTTLTGLRDLKFPAKAKKIAQTRRMFWVLAQNGDLYSFPIHGQKDGSGAATWRKVPTIKDLKDISAGDNHLLMLDSTGSLHAMGSDNLGQCAGGESPRNIGSPNLESKIPNPERVAALEGVKIKRVFSKADQSFVEAENGDVFCFGSNSQMQLAHEEEFESPKNPHLAFYSPMPFNRYLEQSSCELVDIAMGREFTLFHCRNKRDGMTQVYGTGLNLHGELATGATKHVNQFQKIELLSDYTIKSEKGEVPLEITKLTCGDSHCMAQMAIGTVLIWGSNEYGQIGNKKSSMVTSPLIVSAVKGKKVHYVKADQNSNYVLAE